MTFELEPLGELVKLTVVHDGFEPGSLVASMVGKGWPRVLSEPQDAARDRRDPAAATDEPPRPARPAGALSDRGVPPATGTAPR